MVRSTGLFRHSGEEFFIVIGSEAEERDRDSLLLEFSGVGRECGVVFDAGRRIAVGKDDHSGGAVGFNELGNLLHGK